MGSLPRLCLVSWPQRRRREPILIQPFRGEFGFFLRRPFSISLLQLANLHLFLPLFLAMAPEVKVLVLIKDKADAGGVLAVGPSERSGSMELVLGTLK